MESNNLYSECFGISDDRVNKIFQDFIRVALELSEENDVSAIDIWFAMQPKLSEDPDEVWKERLSLAVMIGNAQGKTEAHVGILNQE